MSKDKIWTYKEISKPHLSLLRIIGLIPFENKTLKYIVTQLLISFWICITICYLTMYTGYGVQMLKRKAFEIDYVSEQIICLNISLRFGLLVYKREQFVKLMKICEQLWIYLNPDETVIVRKYERKAYYFWNVIMINVFCTVTIYIVTAHFMTIPPKIENGTDSRILPFRFFIDVQEDSKFAIVCIYQIVVTYFIVPVNTATELVGYYLILLACGYLKAVQIRLLKIAEYQDKIILNNNENENKMIELINNDLLACTKFHQNIMIYCEEIEKFMQSIFFVGVFSTIYNISMIAITMSERDQQFFKYMVILILNMFQFFTYQWSPDDLLTESSAIANAAYITSLKQIGHQKKSNWILYFLISRAQKPVQLTAGGYLRLSMETFGSMIKSAFSFFALLRNVDI